LRGNGGCRRRLGPKRVRYVGGYPSTPGITVILVVVLLSCIFNDHIDNCDQGVYCRPPPWEAGNYNMPRCQCIRGPHTPDSPSIRPLAVVVD